MSAFQRVTTRRLAELTRTTEERLRVLASHPAAHYRKRTHYGRNGKKRVLTIPSPELRRVQRCLLASISPQLGHSKLLPQRI